MGSSALNLGVPPKPEIKHIVTKAQPPSLLISKQDSPQFHAPVPSQKPLPVLPTITGSIPSLPYVNNAPAQPISPPSAPGAASISPITVTHLPNASKRNSLAPLKEVGKRVGVAAAKFVASGVSAMIFGADVTSTIGDALSGAGLAQAGVTAILDAQPNADYSTAIAALQQQQLQHPSPAVDYQILINQIQQLQTIAMQQQQQILSMQLNNISTAGALLGQQQQVNVANANVGAMAPAFGQQIPLAPSAPPNLSNGYSVPQNSYTLNQQQAASPSSTSAQFSPNQHQTPNGSNQGTPNNPPTTPSYLTFGQQQVPSPPPAQGTPQYLHQQTLSPGQQQVPSPPPTQGTPQYLHQQTFSLGQPQQVSQQPSSQPPPFQLQQNNFQSNPNPPQSQQQQIPPDYNQVLQSQISGNQQAPNQYQAQFQQQLTQQPQFAQQQQQQAQQQQLAQQQQQQQLAQQQQQQFDAFYPQHVQTL
ncbi:hypothetical protein EST38_g1629 [Candolleomyces aberdarensis]|uniref:Uncharacterized protein n=1 Tax=Candolleomyces aberdarensis TaxID=2316362 RepID=A0A4Q2DX12_9AGAR|nr:hypothetical protein EST38_g1629 [Candolleomyces aberdarensis]